MDRPLQARETEAAQLVEPRREGDQGGGRGARRRKPEPIQARPGGDARTVHRLGRQQAQVEARAVLRRQVGGEGVEGGGKRLLAGAGQDVADRALAGTGDALLQQPAASSQRQASG